MSEMPMPINDDSAREFLDKVDEFFDSLTPLERMKISLLLATGCTVCLLRGVKPTLPLLSVSIIEDPKCAGCRQLITDGLVSKAAAAAPSVMCTGCYAESLTDPQLCPHGYQLLISEPIEIR